MKALFYILIVVTIAGCAPGHDSTTSKTVAKKTYVPLTEEQKKKFVTPTVYYIPQYDQTTMACSERKSIKSKLGKEIISVCKEIYDDCVMQGTCEITQNGESFLLNVAGKVEGERRFQRLQHSVCVFGKGAVRDREKSFKVMCIDPYFSLAADLSIYKLGDVIYIPDAVGLQLPGGSQHNGYFIVRDTGGGIKGHGRFDFFSGFDSLKNPSHPFRKLQFNDRTTHVPFFLVTGSVAQEILDMRNFPLLPVSN
ncbi:MAG: hypothetical protein A2622_03215 [Bdellovibrionales bacterium RIFCSPHIGHO2_01_FULL_40_29]|nr:MAG: hypothetical protein A2622_03215 [Bdellovibrionales bacterium RIFCSPHIGHO2_01_FULL_40_29]OFZ34083.1 MAG: hypothetical protein A3D17_03635 [Bdellovibrionales bacterium RIFCSPHIGHO2_02_FULL_40_15]